MFIHGSNTNLVSESVNSTACNNSNSYLLLLENSSDFTFHQKKRRIFFRNNGSTYYYQWIIPSGEGNNCFFSCDCCPGTVPNCLDSTNTECILSKFCSINKPVSSGYLHLLFAVTMILRYSIIVLNTSILPYSPHACTILQIEDRLIVTSIPIGVQSYMTIKCLVETDSPPTYIYILLPKITHSPIFLSFSKLNLSHQSFQHTLC